MVPFVASSRSGLFACQNPTRKFRCRNYSAEASARIIYDSQSGSVGMNQQGCVEERISDVSLFARLGEFI